MKKCSAIKIRGALNMAAGLKKKLQSGFTLVEVLVSTFIVATSLVGLLSSYVAARHTASLARHKAQAMNVMQDKMEEMKSLGYDGLLDRSKVDPYQFDYNNNLDADNDNEGGVSCYIASYVWEDPDDSNCLEMWVDIGWPQKTMGYTTWSWDWTRTKVARMGEI
jgi:prepilin-type N-terminal cleavage/methylation domain-containing protein